MEMMLKINYEFWDLHQIKNEKSNDRSYLGAQKLTGENLKLVWAEFSTIS